MSGWNFAGCRHLNLDREGTALDSLLSHSITHRIALGARAGQKAFTLRSLPGTPLPEPQKSFLAKSASARSSSVIVEGLGMVRLPVPGRGRRQRGLAGSRTRALTRLFARSPWSSRGNIIGTATVCVACRRC